MKFIFFGDVLNKIILARVVLLLTLMLTITIDACSLSDQSNSLLVTRTPTSAPTISPTSALPLRNTSVTIEPTASTQTQTPVAMSLLTPIITGTPICETRVYVIQFGDTLSTIASQFSLDVSIIARANNLADMDKIQAGQTLIIPCPDITDIHLSSHILGYSTQDWPIEVYEFGTGPTRLALIGGIHGGYEWNTITLAYQVIDYFTNHPEDIPSMVSLYIMPAANPDGQVLVVGHPGRFSSGQVKGNTVPGRFNGNKVDLNRNWDCDWRSNGVWGDRKIDAGVEPFSEIETQILRDFLTHPPMDGVVFWHSAVPGVFAGECGTDFPQSKALATVYADAADYPFQQTFDSYEVSGDATNWLALQNIPAITVELNNHTDTDWEQNLRAILAILPYFDETQGPPESQGP